MPWRIRKADVDWFKAELWKDLRPFPVAHDPEHFAKDCFDPVLATKEAMVLALLRDKVGEDAVPKPINVEGQVLLLERIEGGRLFDIIRHLRAVANDGEESADAAIRILISRARTRLRAVQLALGDVAGVVAEESYPLATKVTSLLDMFLRVLAIPRSSDAWRDEVDDMADYWEKECVTIPFRDATTKNMFIADRRFALVAGDDADAAQRSAVRDVIRSGDETYWESVPLVDVDFSSVVHLTSIEDDPISLHCHEWTYGSHPISAEGFVLDPALGRPDPRRAAVTAVVRYLRFGGRKLGYYLINPQGFNVRFAYDDQLFYFWRLPEVCDKLCPGFTAEHRNLFDVVQSIAEAVAGASRADRELLTVDHLRKYGEGKVGHYWQQNPIERG